MVQSKAALIVELGDGTIRNQGTPLELGMDGTLAEIINREEVEKDNDDDVHEHEHAEETDGQARVGVDGPQSLITRYKDEGTKPSRQYVTKEERDKGSVSWHVWSTYVRYAGKWWMWTAVFVVYFLAEAALLYQSWVLRDWSDERHGGEPDEPGITSDYLKRREEEDVTTVAGASSTSDLVYWLGLYVIMTLLYSFLNTISLWLSVS
jgi:hypothetical protein